MTTIDPTMSLRIWDQLSDKFDYSQLASNWQKVAAHDHSSTKGVQIPTAGLANGAVTQAKLAAGAVATVNLAPEAISGLTAAASTPAGVVVPFVGAVAPLGWLTCDGSTVSRATYATLWDVFRNGGSTSPYGNGNGTTTFHLPNLDGAFPMGIGNSGTAGATTHTMGQRGGEEKHTLSVSEMPSHAHANSLTDPGHYHGPGSSIYFMTYLGSGGTSGASGAGEARQADSTTSTNTTGITINNANAGGGASHNILPPFTAFRFIIKY